MTFRFLHAADLHLDTPFRGLGRRDPALAGALRDAPLAALDALVATALEREVDLVLLAGDVHDGLERGARAELALARAAARLDAAGITTCVVHGNHDPAGVGWTAVERWPERFRVLSTAGETVALEARDGTPIRVHGVSYGRRHTRESLLPKVPPPAGEGFHVGLLHANAGGAPDHDPYSPCTVDELRARGHRYWALGHVHARAILCADPTIAYPGNLCGRSFRETGPKGALLVEVDGARVAPGFVELAPVRFERLAVDVAEAGDLADLARCVAERGDALARACPDRMLVVRVALHGAGPCAAALARDNAADELLADLRAQSSHREPAFHWADVELDLRPDVDLDALRGRDDPSATLIAIADEHGADARLRGELRHALARRGLLARAAEDAELVRAACLDAVRRLSGSAS